MVSSVYAGYDDVPLLIRLLSTTKAFVSLGIPRGASDSILPILMISQL